jgi:hypothetical protein
VASQAALKKSVLYQGTSFSRAALLETMMGFSPWGTVFAPALIL